MSVQERQNRHQEDHTHAGKDGFPYILFVFVIKIVGLCGYADSLLSINNIMQSLMRVLLWFRPRAKLL